MQNPSTPAPLKSSLHVPSSEPANGVELPIKILYKDIPGLYKEIRAAALRGPSEERKNTEGNRYVDRSWNDMPRDPEPDKDHIDYPVFKEGEDDPDCRIGDKELSYDSDQLHMMYFTGQNVQTAANQQLSSLVNLTMKMSSKSKRPYFVENKTFAPINVKAGDDYLGRMFMDMQNCQDWLPADIHPQDGYPFGDRVSTGLGFRPRANHKDFPTKNGMDYDMRPAYIVIPGSTEEVGEVIFLCGRGFDLKKEITNVGWANLHLIFIRLYPGMGEEGLRSVMDEPMERIRRQRIENKVWFAPTDGSSAWNKAVDEAWEPMVKQNATKVGKVPDFNDQDRLKLLAHVPFRGTVDLSSFEFLSNAYGAHQMYASAFKHILLNQKVKEGELEKVIASLKKVIDDAKKNSSDPVMENAEPDLEGLEEVMGQLTTIKNQLRNKRVDYNHAMDGIPNGDQVLGLLDHSIIPVENKNYVYALSVAVQNPPRVSKPYPQNYSNFPKTRNTSKLITDAFMRKNVGRSLGTKRSFATMEQGTPTLKSANVTPASGLNAPNSKSKSVSADSPATGALTPTTQVGHQPATDGNSNKALPPSTPGVGAGGSAAGSVLAQKKTKKTKTSVKKAPVNWGEMTTQPINMRWKFEFPPRPADLEPKDHSRLVIRKIQHLFKLGRTRTYKDAIIKAELVVNKARAGYSSLAQPYGSLKRITPTNKDGKDLETQKPAAGNVKKGTTKNKTPAKKDTPAKKATSKKPATKKKAQQPQSEPDDEQLDPEDSFVEEPESVDVESELDNLAAQQDGSVLDLDEVMPNYNSAADSEDEVDSNSDGDDSNSNEE